MKIIKNFKDSDIGIFVNSLNSNQHINLSNFFFSFFPKKEKRKKEGYFENFDRI